MRSKILISHEMPLGLMVDKKFDKKYNDYCYALVHLFEKSERYFDYVVSQLRSKRLVIVDNSAFELGGEAYDMDRFATWLDKLAVLAGTAETLEYIIPDSFDNTQKSYMLVRSFQSQYQSSTPGRALAVVQADTGIEWLEYFKILSADPKVSKVCINFLSKAYLEVTEDFGTATLDTRRTAGRLRLFSRAVEKQIATPSKPVHLLGCALPWEFGMYTREERRCISTIDTSSPVIDGLIHPGPNTEAEWRARTTKISTTIDSQFFLPTSDERAAYIKANIKNFRRWNKL